MRRTKSVTQIAIDNLIYQPSRKYRTKRKPTPTESEVVTYDHVYKLLKAKWDRMRFSR